MRARFRLLYHQQTRARLRDAGEGLREPLHAWRNDSGIPTFVHRLDLGREGATFAAITRRVWHLLSYFMLTLQGRRVLCYRLDHFVLLWGNFSPKLTCIGRPLSNSFIPLLILPDGGWGCGSFSVYLSFFYVNWNNSLSTKTEYR